MANVVELKEQLEQAERELVRLRLMAVVHATKQLEQVVVRGHHGREASDANLWLMRQELSLVRHSGTMSIRRARKIEAEWD